MPSYCYLNCEWWQRYFLVLMSVMWLDLPWNTLLMELHNINDWDFSLWREQLSFWVLGFAFLFFLHLPFYPFIPLLYIRWTEIQNYRLLSFRSVSNAFSWWNVLTAGRPVLYFLLQSPAGIAVVCNLALPKYATPEKDVYFYSALLLDSIT